MRFFLPVRKNVVSLQAMNKIFYIVTIFLIVCTLGGCKGYNDLLKSNDNEAKYEAAVKFYNEKSYSRANQLFENLSLHYRGRDHAENIAWYYANTLMNLSETYMAEYQFRLFTRRYPYSEHIEEAYYLMAYCCYMESPEYYLDQNMTKTAISEFEQFAERFPQSVHMPQVNQYLDELRNKLMQKDYEIALGYYNTESYHAAYEALGNFINLYPDSPYREDAMYYVICAGYEYAANSREDKVKERMQLVVNDFDRFSALFQNSKHLKNAQDIYTKARAAMAAADKVDNQ